MLAVFREICAIAEDDGAAFDQGAPVRVVIEIGFGDAVEPGIAETEYPVLLDLLAPRLRTYSRETVVAEKFEALVKPGRANSRVKDFYDIWLLSREYRFEGDALARANAAAFARRKTQIPGEHPFALTSEFAADTAKQQLWTSFAQTIGAELPPLDEVVEELATFLEPRC